MGAWTYRHRRVLNAVGLLSLVAMIVLPVMGFAWGAFAFLVAVPLLLLGLFNAAGDPQDGDPASPAENISAGLRYSEPSQSGHSDYS